MTALGVYPLCTYTSGICRRSMPLSRPTIVCLNLIAMSLACVCFAGAQPAVPARTPTIDQSLEMRRVGSPKISPDGRRVVYQQSRTNWETNAFETDLWL